MRFRTYPGRRHTKPQPWRGIARECIPGISGGTLEPRPKKCSLCRMELPTVRLQGKWYCLGCVGQVVRPRKNLFRVRAPFRLSWYNSGTALLHGAIFDSRGHFLEAIYLRKRRTGNGNEQN